VRNRPRIRTARIPKAQLHSFLTYEAGGGDSSASLSAIQKFAKYGKLTIQQSKESVNAERCFGQLNMWFPVLSYTVTVDQQKTLQ
jgi:hypothetical protein